jgi:hypothetical protein
MHPYLSRLKSKIRNTHHHFRSANWTILREYEQMRRGRKNLPLWTFLSNSWRYGADFEDNYQLDFFNKSPEEIFSYVTRSLFFEFCEQVNQVDKIPVTRDKQRFAEHFKDFLGRKVWTWEDILVLPDSDLAPQRLVVKQRWGGKGEGVYFLEPGIQPWSELRELLKTQFSTPTDYVYEEYLVQHPDLSELNPGSVNTVRIHTFVEPNHKVSIWGMYLRVGSGSGLDSISQGGIALSLDETGHTCTPCFTQNPLIQDPFTEAHSRHDLAQEKCLGFQLPHFEAMKKMVCQSALLIPEVRAIGWDVAIKSEGPCLIEANDRCCHVYFQKTPGQGARYLLTPHFEDRVYRSGNY